jgi:hypothetical protein
MEITSYIQEAYVGGFIPIGFLSIGEAAERLAVALFAGTPDRLPVTRIKEAGFDVADGEAVARGVESIWAAVDKGSLAAFLVGPGCTTPMKFSAAMSKEVPLLRSPRGGDFNFLRPGKPIHFRFMQWFGCDLDLTQVTVIFRENDIDKLGRTLFRARRRKIAANGKGARGRPSQQAEVKSAIREVIEQGRWAPTDSLKALTSDVNRRRSCPNVSDDTVDRALKNLHIETGDRRFERVRREPLTI